MRTWLMVGHVASLAGVSAAGLIACGGGGDGGGPGPVVVTSVTLTAGATAIADCGQTGLTAVGYDDQGRPVTGLVFTYSSSDPSVLAVSNAGTVTATGAGLAYARVAAGSLADSVAITVADSVVAGLVKHFSDLQIGGKDTLAVEVRDCRGALRSFPVVTFTSGSPAIVTVTSAGEITGVAGGQAFVHVAATGLDDSADVAVLTHPTGILGSPSPVSSQPFGIAVRRSGQVLIAQLSGGGVAVLPAGGGLPFTIPTGLFPTDVTTSYDGHFAFVTNQGNQQVGRVDLMAGSQVTAYPAPFDVFRVRLARDRNRLFVTGNSTIVRALDLQTGAVVGQYTVEKDQNGVAESLDGSMLYVSSMTGVVREITEATQTTGRTFASGGTTQDVALSADGAELFVAVETSTYVQVWDISSGTKVDSIDVGAGTFGLGLSPDGQRLYATSPSAGEVHIINPAARALLGTIPVAGLPRRIAFNAAGTQAYVSNEAGWVDIIH